MCLKTIYNPYIFTNCKALLMLKNYFVLDLSKVCHKAAEKIFFDHLHLDNQKSHFEVFTSSAELLTPLLRKYNLKATLEITSIYVDQDSQDFYEQSCDKAFLKEFDYIAYFNHLYQSADFIDTQIEVPKRVYYSKIINSQNKQVNNVFALNDGSISFQKSLNSQCQFAGTPFFGTCYPVTELSTISENIAQAFSNLKHSELVGLFISQLLIKQNTRPVFIPENITLALSAQPLGLYKVHSNKNAIEISKVPAYKSFFKNIFSKKADSTEILTTIYN